MKDTVWAVCYEGRDVRLFRDFDKAMQYAEGYVTSQAKPRMYADEFDSLMLVEGEGLRDAEEILAMRGDEVITSIIVAAREVL